MWAKRRAGQASWLDENAKHLISMRPAHLRFISRSRGLVSFMGFWLPCSAARNFLSLASFGQVRTSQAMAGGPVDWASDELLDPQKVCIQ